MSFEKPASKEEQLPEIRTWEGEQNQKDKEEKKEKRLEEIREALRGRKEELEEAKQKEEQMRNSAEEISELEKTEEYGVVRSAIITLSNQIEQLEKEENSIPNQEEEGERKEEENEEESMETMLQESGFYDQEDGSETKFSKFAKWEEEQNQMEEKKETTESIRNTIEEERCRILFESNFYNLPEERRKKMMIDLGKKSGQIRCWIENLKESLNNASPEKKKEIEEKIKFLKNKRAGIWFELQTYHLAPDKRIPEEDLNSIAEQVGKVAKKEKKDSPRVISLVKKFFKEHPNTRGGFATVSLSFFAVFMLILLKAFEKLTGERIENKK